MIDDNRTQWYPVMERAYEVFWATDQIYCYDFYPMQGLLEAVEIEKGNVSLIQKEHMPAPTFIASEREKELIDEIVNLRKEQNMSQNQLAKLTGNKQQAISRIEKKEHNPSLKSFYSIVNALGYDLKIVKV